MVVRLSEGQEVVRPAAFAEIVWRVAGPDPEVVILDVVSSGASGLDQSAPAHVQGGSGSLIVSQLVSEATILARSSQGNPLPAGLNVHVSINLRGSSGESEQVVLDPIDVSASRSHELFTLVPAGEPGRWVVRASAGMEQVELPARPQAAYYAARRARTATVPGSIPGVPPAVAVDVSASMSSVLGDGRLLALTELIVGVNAWAHGLSASSTMWSTAPDAGRLDLPLSAATLPAVLSAYQGLPVENGFRLAPLLSRIASSGTDRVIVITDGPPGDVADLAATLEQAHKLICILLVVARSRFDSDPQLRPGPPGEELGPLVPLADGQVLRVVSIDPDHLISAMDDQRHLDLLVAALLDALLD